MIEARQTDASTQTTRIMIVGGGFSGIGMAIRLRQEGIEDFVILERAAAPGGTWRDNSYPGCACDVQSTLYSYSFAPNPDWSRTFSPQPEIQAYLDRCVSAYDIGRHFRFDQALESARWDDATQRWQISASRGRWSAEVLIMATGPLSEPKLPSVRGLDTFRGAHFHSARWDHRLDLRGKRVAVIGTGASAVQFVPRIQPMVAQLSLFQRSAPWILPRWDRAVPAWRKSLYHRVPAAQRVERAALYALREMLLIPFRHPPVGRVVERVARWHMESQVSDPSLRAKLVPDYRIGCKRIMVSDDYYPAISQPNVSLVTNRIESISADGVQTSDGVTHPAEVIILGTGFHVTDPPLAPHVFGRDGVSLASAWHGSPRAYMSTTEAGFPNFFMLLGPNTAIGNTSILLIVEAQYEHVLRLLRATRAQGAGSVEPRADAQRRYVAWIDGRLATTVWNRGGCSSWYLDGTGRNSALWPDGTGAFRRKVERPRFADYLFTPAIVGVTA